MAYWRLLRPLNALIAGLVAVTGAFIAGATDWLRVILAGFCGAFLIGWANIDNDLADIVADRASHPARPLARGQVPEQRARMVSWLLLIPAMAIACFLPPASILAFLAILGLVALYNRHLKNLPLVSNATVALAAALGFPFGGFLGPDLAPALWACLLAFFFHLAREMLKSLEDADGDRAAGRKTIPVIHGPVAGLTLATVFAALLVAVSPLPFLVGALGPAYLVIVVIFVDAAWVGLLAYAWARRRYGIASTLAKMDMLAALAALAAGRVFPGT